MGALNQTGITGCLFENSPRPGAPLRNRTVDLLLTIYTCHYAVATSAIAGQATVTPSCCGPTYMVIRSS